MIFWPILNKNRWFIQDARKCVCVCLLSFCLFCYLLHCNCKHFFIRYVYIISIPWGNFGLLPGSCLPQQSQEKRYPSYGQCARIIIIPQATHRAKSQYFCGTTKLKDRPCNNHLTIFLWNRQTQRQAMQQQSHNMFVEQPNSKTGHVAQPLAVWVWKGEDVWSHSMWCVSAVAANYSTDKCWCYSQCRVMAHVDAAKHMMQSSLDEVKGYKIRISVANFRYFQCRVMAHHVAATRDAEFTGRSERLNFSGNFTLGGKLQVLCDSRLPELLLVRSNLWCSPLKGFISTNSTLSSSLFSQKQVS